jgi:K+ transporter
VVLVTVVIEEAPRIADEDRAEVAEIIEGITRVILHFGFMQYPTIAEGLALASSQGKLPGIDLRDVTCYIGRETVIPARTCQSIAKTRSAFSSMTSRTLARELLSGALTRRLRVPMSRRFRRSVSICRAMPGSIVLPCDDLFEEAANSLASDASAPLMSLLTQC